MSKRPAGQCAVGQISPSNSQSNLSFPLAITEHFVSSWSAARKHHSGVGGGDIDAQSSVRGAPCQRSPRVVAVVQRDGLPGANGQLRGAVPPRDYELAA